MSEEKSEPIDKKKIETVKYLLSSLFARKQKYLVVDGNNKNSLIYANFPYERTINYRSTPEDSVCCVMVNDTVAPLIHEAFPVFDKIIAEIELMPFMAAFNKSIAKDKTKWPEVKIDNETDKLFVEIEGDEKQEDEGTEEKKTALKIVVGRLLPPDSTSLYKRIVDQFLSFTDSKEEVEFEIPQGHDQDPVILVDLLLKSLNSTFRCPIKDGLSMVSFKEYLNKRKLPIKYKALVMCRPEMRAAKVAFEHEDDWVKCLSLMPGTLWLPFI